ncbi:unnamed protein product [Heterosigma akashiwo]
MAPTTAFNVSTGTAKPTPALAPDGVRMAVFMPTSAPSLSRRAPPEFPGLMAASVWMQLLIGRRLGLTTSRPSPDTIPRVREWSSPKGFPIANTDWPTCRSAELPSRIALNWFSLSPLLCCLTTACPVPPTRNPLLESIFRTAMSESGSAPTKLAGYW